MKEKEINQIKKSKKKKRKVERRYMNGTKKKKERKNRIKKLSRKHFRRILNFSFPFLFTKRKF